MKYKSGYKYVLAEDITIQSPYRTANFSVKRISLINACGGYVDVMGDGTMTVRKGYAWDGPSGPAFDTKSFMRGSLFHDVSYQLIREGCLNIEQRDVADDWLLLICKEDGMLSLSRWIVHWCLRKFGEGATDSNHDSQVLEAP